MNHAAIIAMRSAPREAGRKPPRWSTECFELDANVGRDVFDREPTVAPPRQQEWRRSAKLLAPPFARQSAHHAADEAVGAGRKDVDDPVFAGIQRNRAVGAILETQLAALHDVGLRRVGRADPTEAGETAGSKASAPAPLPRKARPREAAIFVRLRVIGYAPFAAAACAIGRHRRARARGCRTTIAASHWRWPRRHGARRGFPKPAWHRDRTQHRLGSRHAPGTHMGPQHQIGDALGRRDGERNVAAAVGIGPRAAAPIMRNGIFSVIGSATPNCMMTRRLVMV